MAIDLYDPDRRCEPGEAGWRAPPRCYTRPAMPEAIVASRSDADGNTHLFAFGVMLVAFWCVAAFLILQNGWSF
jgi:hypothetical protein